MWTWFRTKSPAPIPESGHLYDYCLRPLFGRWQNAVNAFGPYRRPILDATGGGNLNLSQLLPFSPNCVIQQGFTPVSITGNGSELTGAYNVIGLVNTTNPNANGAT